MPFLQKFIAATQVSVFVGCLISFGEVSIIVTDANILHIEAIYHCHATVTMDHRPYIWGLTKCAFNQDEIRVEKEVELEEAVEGRLL